MYFWTYGKTLFCTYGKTLIWTYGKTHFLILENMLLLVKKISVTLFKYFFRQFSCTIYVEIIFQVSIKSVEQLRRKMMNKFSMKWN